MRKFLVLFCFVLLFSGVFAAAPEQKLKGDLLSKAMETKEAVQQGKGSGEKLEKVLIQLDNEQNLSNVKEMVYAKGAKNAMAKRIGKTIVAEVPRKKLLEIAQDLNVLGIWPDLEVEALDEEALEQINAKEAWAYGLTGAGIKIAVLDTGIDSSHNALQGKILGETNFSDSSTVNDLQGHGTHVAGIIAGSGDVNGVAPNAQLLNVKVLNDYGSGTISSVIEGINWAVEHDADIINLSLGATSHETNTPLNQAVRDAIETGVVVVIASGNCGECGSCNGFLGVTMPGNTIEAISVGAVNSENAHACFSSGEIIEGKIKPDLSAPGVGILSSIPNNLTGEKTGTSMSTPFATGTIALLLEKRIELSPWQAKYALENTALDLGETGKDVFYGSGLIDVAELIELDLDSLPDDSNGSGSDYNTPADFNVLDSSFSFSGPETLNKNETGTFTVNATAPQGLEAMNYVSKDCIIEFVTLDEFGNPVDRAVDGPYELDYLIPEVFEYQWQAERTGNFTIQATAYIEGDIVEVFSTQENVKTATAEKGVKVTVPADLLAIIDINSPVEIQKGENPEFSVSVLANNSYLQSMDTSGYAYRAPIEICADSELNNNTLVFVKEIDFSSMNVLENLDDVRVFDIVSAIELARTVEGNSQSTDGNLFFNLDNEIASSQCESQRYYLYWENPDAEAPDTSVSSKEGFESYAEGTTTPFGIWDLSYGSGPVEVSTGHAKSGSKALKVTGQNNYVTGSFTPLEDSTRQWTYSVWVYPAYYATSYVAIEGFHDSTQVYDWFFGVAFTNENYDIIDLPSGTQLAGHFDLDKWYKIEFTYNWHSTTHKTCVFEGAEETLLGCAEDLSNYQPASPFGGKPLSIEFAVAQTSGEFWFDDAEFFAPYSTNVSLGETEIIGNPTPEATDINAIVSVFVKDESDSIIGFLGSQEKNILKDANTLFDFDEAINLPGGDYNLEAVLLFEDRNISIKKPLKISVEGFAGIESVFVPPEIEKNSQAAFLVNVRNNSSLELSPIVLLKIMDGNNTIASVMDANKTIGAGQLEAFVFDWNAEIAAGEYDVNAVLLLDNYSELVSQPTNIIDSVAPEILETDFSLSIEQGTINPVSISLQDSSEISGIVVISTSPSLETEQITLNKTDVNENTFVFTGAFKKFDETGDYSLVFDACDEFNNCTEIPAQTFSVVSPDPECLGKNILLVLDNDNFNIGGQEWISSLQDVNFCFVQWKTREFGALDINFLQRFDAVLWSTGNNYGFAVDSNDSEMLESFVSQGGRLFIEGSDVSSEHGFDSFAENVLNAEFASEIGLDESFISVPLVFSEPNVLGISGWVDVNFSLAEYADSLIPRNNGIGIASWNAENLGVIAGQDALLSSKTLFVPFSLDSIAESDRIVVLNKGIAWLLTAPAPINSGSAPKITISAPEYGSTDSNQLEFSIQSTEILIALVVVNNAPSQDFNAGSHCSIGDRNTICAYTESGLIPNQVNSLNITAFDKAWNYSQAEKKFLYKQP